MTYTSCPRPMDGPRQLFKGTLAANVPAVPEPRMRLREGVLAPKRNTVQLAAGGSILCLSIVVDRTSELERCLF